MEWTEDTIIRLRELWAEGHSTAEIGRRLGVSKNAIVGKAHRLDLPARPSPIRRDASSSDGTRAAPTRRVDGPTLPPLASTDTPLAAPVATLPISSVSAEAPLAPAMLSAGHATVQRSAVAAPVAPPRPVALAPVRVPSPTIRPYARIVTCCWPIGEPGAQGFRFCDDSSEPGKPYCAEHAKLAYVRVRDRREDAA